MQKMGLSVADRAAFEATLRTSHTRRIIVYVTSLEGDVLANVAHVLLDGQVVVDLDAEVTRSATLQFLDPSHSLGFDTDAPDDGALYADRMVRIDYAVFVPSLDKHVPVTVFHGPVTKLSRNGDVVNVEAQGKESLAMGAIWRPLILKKNMKRTAAIRTLLQRAGESQFDMPAVPNDPGLPKARSLSRLAAPWPVARKIARSMNRQLFYPGNGVATLRRFPNRSVYTFRTGTGGDVVSDVSVSYNTDTLANTIVVKGGVPKGAKKAVQATAVAPATHPLSPKRLGRNGTPRHLVEVVEDTAIRSDREARRVAKRILEDRLRQVVEVQFDALPIPHLDPGDLVTVTTDDVTLRFRLRQFSIPLGASGAPVMPVGYLKRTTPNRRSIRK